MQIWDRQQVELCYESFPKAAPRLDRHPHLKPHPRLTKLCLESPKMLQRLDLHALIAPGAPHLKLHLKPYAYIAWIDGWRPRASQRPPPLHPGRHQAPKASSPDRGGSPRPKSSLRVRDLWRAAIARGRASSRRRGATRNPSGARLLRRPEAPCSLPISTLWSNCLLNSALTAARSPDLRLELLPAARTAPRDRPTTPKR